jgi:hypothetical protein
MVQLAPDGAPLLVTVRCERVWRRPWTMNLSDRTLQPKNHLAAARAFVAAFPVEDVNPKDVLLRHTPISPIPVASRTVDCGLEVTVGHGSSATNLMVMVPLCVDVNGECTDRQQGYRIGSPRRGCRNQFATFDFTRHGTATSKHSRARDIHFAKKPPWPSTIDGPSRPPHRVECNKFSKER